MVVIQWLIEGLFQILTQLVDRFLNPFCGMVRTAPRSPEEGQDPETSFFTRHRLQAARRADSWDRRNLDEAICYFERLAAMPPARRALLEASVAGVLLGFAAGGGW